MKEIDSIGNPVFDNHALCVAFDQLRCCPIELIGDQDRRLFMAQIFNNHLSHLSLISVELKRRQAREYALQILFQIDFTGGKIGGIDFAEFWSDKKESGDVKEFTEKLVNGTLDKLDEIDKMIEKFTENWLLKRMAAVDRNILRFAVYEILYRKDIPSAVTINEAIEIAKKYSSTEAASFLNGVLDRLAKETGKA
jgi:transcription antitermination protein NusB